MTRRHSFLKVGLVAAATTALALTVTVPVSAHTGSLFTVAASGDTTETFASISSTNAAVSPIGGAIPGAGGVEIFNETAYAIFEDGHLVTWDHNTGAILTSVPLSIEGYDSFGVFALDTTTDGTLLTYARVTYTEDDALITEEWVASLDPATGVLTPRVEVTDVDPFLDSLATNPVTGVTYSFVDIDDGVPQYVTIDLAAASVLASSTGEFGASAGAVAVGTVSDVSTVNLAYDPFVAAAPALADTGVDASAVALGALALLGAGAVALLVVRRRTA
jgi:LPXTG-motif cell wall-anchored protein